MISATEIKYIDTEYWYTFTIIVWENRNKLTYFKMTYIEKQ